jgi:hypothetical protein
MGMVSCAPMESSAVVTESNRITPRPGPNLIRGSWWGRAAARWAHACRMRTCAGCKRAATPYPSSSGQQCQMGWPVAPDPRATCGAGQVERLPNGHWRPVNTYSSEELNATRVVIKKEKKLRCLGGVAYLAPSGIKFHPPPQFVGGSMIKEIL